MISNGVGSVLAIGPIIPVYHNVFSDMGLGIFWNLIIIREDSFAHIAKVYALARNADQKTGGEKYQFR